MQLLKNNKLKKSFLLFAISIAMLYLGCSKTNDYSTSPDNNGTPAANEIFIQGMAFSPANMTVNVGTTVKWTNKDNIAHTVTSGTPSSTSGIFDSGNMVLNGNFTFKFNTIGTFKYFCKIHTIMTGTIIVK